MGVFKGVGYPEDIGRFYRLEEYQGYCFTAHGRYPTNTPGWWGGAHPFALLDYSVVHNGEISSYDANRRSIEMYGYTCTLQTDTEAVSYTHLDVYKRQPFIPMMKACIFYTFPACFSFSATKRRWRSMTGWSTCCLMTWELAPPRSSRSCSNESPARFSPWPALWMRFVRT